jgi:hypothetical protein
MSLRGLRIRWSQGTSKDCVHEEPKDREEEEVERDKR